MDVIAIHVTMIVMVISRRPAPACTGDSTCTNAPTRPLGRRGQRWAFIVGRCSGRGVQWMGVVLSNKTICNIIM